MPRTLSTPLSGADVFGSKPVTPSLQDAQMQAILGNLGAFGDLANLSGQTNQFNQGQVLEQLRRAVPGYDEINAQQSQNILNMLNGRLPPEVLRALQEQSASYGVSSGTLGSGFQANQGLRNLGLNAMDYMNQGAQLANQTLANRSSIGTTPILNPAASYVTPGEQTQRNLYESLVAAAPEPTARGRYEENLAREMAALARAAGVVPPPGSTGVAGATRPAPDMSSRSAADNAPLLVSGGTRSVPFNQPQRSAFNPSPSREFSNVSGALWSNIGTYGATGAPSSSGVLNTYQPPYAAAPSTSYSPMLDFTRDAVARPPIFDWGSFGDYSPGPPSQSTYAPAFETRGDYSGPEMGPSTEDILNDLLGISDNEYYA